MFSVLAVARYITDECGDDRVLRKVESMIRAAGVSPERLQELAIRRYQDGRWPLGIRGAVPPAPVQADADSSAATPQAEPEAQPVSQDESPSGGGEQ